MENEVRSHPQTPMPASSSSPSTEGFLQAVRPPPEGVSGGSLYAWGRLTAQTRAQNLADILKRQDSTKNLSMQSEL